MYFYDFEYNGKMLSDYDSMICSFGSSDSDEVSLGSELTWNTIKNNHSYASSVVSSSYDDNYTAQLSICKKKCNSYISNTYSDLEIRNITKWLNSKKFYKFKPVYKDGEMQDVYYIGSFNLTAVTVGSSCIGFNLTFQSNSPFGFAEKQIFDFTNIASNQKMSIDNNSDEYDYIYPKIKITLHENGKLILNNISFSDSMVVDNCQSGEVLHFDGETKTIVSSLGTLHSNLYSDFNYNFLKIFCEEEKTENIITSSLPCDLTIEFSERRKIGVI